MTAAEVAACRPPAVRSLTIGGRAWPVVPPSPHDPRLHTAAIVMTVHSLGQVSLGFAVSVPQIAAAILGAALVEFVVTITRRGVIAWPGSAMLTGSGVGLILRVEGTIPGDHWSVHHWWWFSLIAAGSLLTKYLIRWRGAHLFNPSNLGLVVAFLALGSRRVEPLPFHWADMGPGMAIAHTVIVVGGIVITRRLGLLAMAATFWLAFVSGITLLAWSGHCLTVPWQLTPVCDARFAWALATSPEVFVFLFFMLTDPRTVPRSARGRVAFALAVGLVATVLIAPQRTEFGAKVALLGALCIVCAAQPGVAWLRARPWSTVADLSADARGLLVGIGIVLGSLTFVGVTVAAGTGTREPAVAAPIGRLPAVPDVDWTPPPSLPDVTVDDDAMRFDPSMADPAARRALLHAMLRDLAIERYLLGVGDGSSLAAVDHGTRLVELQTALRSRSGPPVEVPQIAAISTAVLGTRRPGRQSSPVLAITVTGTQTRGDGGAAPWSAVVSLRQADDGRWLIVDLAAN